MSKQTMITRTAYGWSALDSAVVDQLGYNSPVVDGERVTIDAEAAGALSDVLRCSCGAAGGFGGFIYYHETWQFFRANRAAIRSALQELAESYGDGGAVELVRGFATFGDKPSADDVGRVLWGDLPEKWGGAPDCGVELDLHNIANACAWFALEETARKWSDGEEVEQEGGEE